MRHLFILVLLSLFAYTAAHTQTSPLARFMKKHDASNGTVDIQINGDNYAKGIEIGVHEHNYKQVKTEARRLVRKGNFEPLIQINRQVEVLMREAKGDKKELVLLLNTEEKFVVLNYIGTFSLDMLNKVSKEIDIEL